jgi:hypothetical protein
MTRMIHPATFPSLFPLPARTRHDTPPSPAQSHTSSRRRSVHVPRRSPAHALHVQSPLCNRAFVRSRHTPHRTHGYVPATIDYPPSTSTRDVGRGRGKAYISQQRETDIDQQVSAAAGDEEDADGGELSRQHYTLLKIKPTQAPGDAREW